MRFQPNVYDASGRLMEGYDYKVQAWVQDGRYARCGHDEYPMCKCYGRKHQGQPTVAPVAKKESHV